MGLFDRTHDAPHRRYRMQAKMFSIGDDFWIEDDGGTRVFKVDGKAARLRDTFELEDRTGRRLATIREKKLSVRDRIDIELADGRSASVKKALVGFRDRYQIAVDGGEDLKAHGNIVDHEYEIERDGDTIAEVSKRWFRVRDTYGIELFDEADTVLLLSATVAIDALARELG